MERGGIITWRATCSVTAANCIYAIGEFMKSIAYIFLLGQNSFLTDISTLRRPPPRLLGLIYDPHCVHCVPCNCMYLVFIIANCRPNPSKVSPRSTQQFSKYLGPSRRKNIPIDGSMQRAENLSPRATIFFKEF